MTINYFDDIRESYDTSAGQPRLVTAEEVQRQGNPAMTVEASIAALEAIPGALAFKVGAPDADVDTAFIIVNTGTGDIYGKNGDVYQRIYTAGSNSNPATQGITQTEAENLFYLKAQVDQRIQAAIANIPDNPAGNASSWKGRYDASNLANYAINDTVIEGSDIYTLLVADPTQGPSEANVEWQKLTKEPRTNAEIDARIHQVGGLAEASRFAPYVPNAIRFFDRVSVEHTESFSVNAPAAVRGYLSWRGNPDAYSPSNPLGIIASPGVSLPEEGNHIEGGIGDATWMKMHVRSETARAGIWFGYDPTTNLEIPIIRITNTGLIQYNRNGNRGAQDWRTFQFTEGAGGNAQGTPGSPLAIEVEVTKHDRTEFARNDYEASFELILGYNNNGTYHATDNVHVKRTADLGFIRPTSDFDSGHHIDVIWSDAYDSHAQETAMLMHGDERFLGRIVITNHENDKTVFTGDLQVKGTLTDTDGNPITPGMQGEQGPQGQYPITLYHITLHGADRPGKPTVTGIVNGELTGVPDTWGTEISASLDEDRDDLWGSVVTVDPAGNNGAGSIVRIGGVVRLDSRPGQEGPEGPQGPPGEDGTDGAPGTDGSDGTDGTPGTDGNDGTNGWSPIFALITDGAREVLRHIGWTGGTGTQPASGQYISGTGGVTDIALGRNLKGSDGSPDTAAQIKTKLETLTGNNRLDASAVKNIPTGGGGGTIATGSIYGDPVHNQNWDLRQNPNFRYQNGVSPGANEFIIEIEKWYRFEAEIIFSGLSVILSQEIKGERIPQGTPPSPSHYVRLNNSAGGTRGNFYLDAFRDLSNRLLLTSDHNDTDPMPLRIYEIKAPKGDPGEGMPEVPDDAAEGWGVRLDSSNEPAWVKLKTNNLVANPGTDRTVTLPADYADYTMLEGVYSSNFEGQFSIPIGYLASLPTGTHEIRSQGSDRVTWNKETRVLGTKDSDEELVWIQLTR